mmetsp:Transcript_48589/g.125245  ORF Transcript_48589/g.125245 Transcript_48589/m.125245 type:complete len:129 (+) Transcript_48589:1061-1447(+)
MPAETTVASGSVVPIERLVPAWPLTKAANSLPYSATHYNGSGLWPCEYPSMNSQSGTAALDAANATGLNASDTASLWPGEYLGNLTSNLTSTIAEVFGTGEQSAASPHSGVAFTLAVAMFAAVGAGKP